MKSNSNISFRLYLAALVFAPLAFGTTEVWSYAVLEALAIAALLLFIRESKKNKGKLLHVPGLLPLGLVLCLALIQIIPLPSFLIGLISPQAQSLRAESVGVMGEISWATLSLYPKATAFQFFRIAAYASLYVLTIQYAVNSRKLHRMVYCLIITGAAIAVLAILQYFSQAPYVVWPLQKIYWLRPLTEGGSPFGPFVNRNHFAGWMAMVLPLAVSMFLYRKPKSAYSGFKEKLVALFTHRYAGQRILVGFAALVMAVSVFVSLSRGGIIAISVGMLLFILLFAVRMRSHRVRLIVILSVVLVSLSVGWFGWQPIFDRFEGIRSSNGQIENARFEIWRDTRQLIASYPVVGTGYGTFRYVYPAFQTAELSENVQPRYAHNDYLQFLAEGGVIGAGFSVWFCVSVVMVVFRRLFKRRDPWAISLGSAALGGMTAVLAHSVVDFNFYIGANALYFFVLCGIGIGGTHIRTNNFLNPTYLSELSHPYRIGLKSGAIILGGTILGFYVQTFYAGYNFEALLNADKTVMEDKEWVSDLRYDAQSAKSIDPWQTHYAIALGQIEMSLGNPQQALTAYKDVLLYDPNDDEVLQRAGFCLDTLGQSKGAEQLIRAGVQRAPRKAIRRYHMSAWLLRNDRRGEAIDELRQALAMDPKLIDQAIVLLLQHQGTVDDIFKIMPATAKPHVYVAKFYQTIGDTVAAEKMYVEAFRAAQSQEQVAWGDFQPVYDYYRKSDRLEDALYVAQKAAERIPQNTTVHWVLASSYEKLGIPFRALEEYRNVLLIDPHHKHAQTRINRLSGTQ